MISIPSKYVVRIIMAVCVLTMGFLWWYAMGKLPHIIHVAEILNRSEIDPLTIPFIKERSYLGLNRIVKYCYSLWYVGDHYQLLLLWGCIGGLGLVAWKYVRPSLIDTTKTKKGVWLYMLLLGIALWYIRFMTAHRGVRISEELTLLSQVCLRSNGYFASPFLVGTQVHWSDNFSNSGVQWLRWIYDISHENIVAVFAGDWIFSLIALVLAMAIACTYWGRRVAVITGMLMVFLPCEFAEFDACAQFSHADAAIPIMAGFVLTIEIIQRRMRSWRVLIGYGLFSLGGLVWHPDYVPFFLAYTCMLFFYRIFPLRYLISVLIGGLSFFVAINYMLHHHDRIAGAARLSDSFTAIHASDILCALVYFWTHMIGYWFRPTITSQLWASLYAYFFVTLLIILMGTRIYTIIRKNISIPEGTLICAILFYWGCFSGLGFVAAEHEPACLFPFLAMGCALVVGQWAVRWDKRAWVRSMGAGILVVFPLTVVAVYGGVNVLSYPQTSREGVWNNNGLFMGVPRLEPLNDFKNPIEIELFANADRWPQMMFIKNTSLYTIQERSAYDFVALCHEYTRKEPQYKRDYYAIAFSCFPFIQDPLIGLSQIGPDSFSREQSHAVYQGIAVRLGLFQEFSKFSSFVLRLSRTTVPDFYRHYFYIMLGERLGTGAQQYEEVKVYIEHISAQWLPYVRMGYLFGNNPQESVHKHLWYGASNEEKKVYAHWNTLRPFLKNDMRAMMKYLYEKDKRSLVDMTDAGRTFCRGYFSDMLSSDEYAEVMSVGENGPSELYEMGVHMRVGEDTEMKKKFLAIHSETTR